MKKFNGFELPDNAVKAALATGAGGCYYMTSDNTWYFVSPGRKTRQVHSLIGQSIHIGDHLARCRCFVSKPEAV